MARDYYVIWSAGRYKLWRHDRGVMGPQFALADEADDDLAEGEYGQDLAPEELAELRDILIEQLGPK